MSRSAIRVAQLAWTIEAIFYIASSYSELIEHGGMSI